MNSDSLKIYVAGHRGLVGSAIVRVLNAEGQTGIVTRTRNQLDLTDQAAVRTFFLRKSRIKCIWPRLEWAVFLRTILIQPSSHIRI